LSFIIDFTPGEPTIDSSADYTTSSAATTSQHPEEPVQTHHRLCGIEDCKQPAPHRKHAGRSLLHRIGCNQTLAYTNNNHHHRWPFQCQKFDRHSAV
jgi:hypothetical protein